jgi:hypothetical protein
MEPGMKAKYSSQQESMQTMEMMGQSMETNSTKRIVFSLVSKGQTDGNYQLGVTIDSLAVDASSPQGEMSADVGSAIGKSFDMTLSSLGEEGGFSGIEKIKYSIGPQGSRGVDSDFQTFFPNLAGKPLKPGNTWTSKDTIRINEGGMELILSFDYTHTLAGFETIQDSECARITSKFTGTLEGKGNQMGADLTFEGDMEGNETWYFAYKKGIFVQGTSQSFTEGTVAVTGAANMTIPMTTEMKLKVNLIQ